MNELLNAYVRSTRPGVLDKTLPPHFLSSFIFDRLAGRGTTKTAWASIIKNHGPPYYAALLGTFFAHDKVKG